MFTPHTPPPHPDEHLMHDRNRRHAAEHHARTGRSRGRLRGLSTGDKILFLVLGVAAVAAAWLFLSWLLEL